ncbi:LPD38 domain-containing protein [Roseateles sp.]|uniref:LPD38 domain-containing protein n=1 Tax=Roseateles sp. TaxID=1971397 RepID=UPI002E006FC4|nr:LPD38 domain-containing protein [Roseateles sp.]
MAMVRERFGPEGTSELIASLNQAANPRVPEVVRARHLQAVEEALFRIRAQRLPAEQAAAEPLALERRQQLMLENQPSPDRPAALGYDATPTGTIRVDAAGNAVPETRAQAIDAAQPGQQAATAAAIEQERQQVLGEQSPRATFFAGDPINSEWTAFSPQSGTLGVPRAEMPQVKAEARGALVNFLNARGIASEPAVEVPADSLKPTQAEFSPQKVAQAKEFKGGERSILVSSDGHIIDGHHQWAAAVEQGRPVKVIRLDAPAAQLLDAVRQFPSAETAQGADAAPAVDLESLPPQTLHAMAYGDSDTVAALQAEARPELRAIGDALQAAAPEWAGMRDAVLRGDAPAEVDITGNLVAAVDLVREAAATQSSLFERVQQADPITAGLVRTMFEGNYLTIPAKPGETEARLRAYAQAARAAGGKSNQMVQLAPDEVAAAVVQGVLNDEANATPDQGEPAVGVDLGWRAAEPAAEIDDQPGDGTAGRGEVQPEPDAAGTQRRQADARREAAQEGDEAAGVTRFSRSPATYGQAVDAVLDEKIPESQALAVADPLPVLAAVGLPDLPVHTTGDRLMKMHYDHGLTRADLKALPELLANPVMVFDSATQPGAKVLVLDLWRRGMPVVAAVRPNVELKRVEVNLLASAYPKDKPEQLGAWVQQGLLKYADKSKTRAWATNGGVQFPWLVQLQRGSGSSVLGPQDVGNPAGGALSRGPGQPGGAMSVPAVEDLARSLAAGWARAPEIIVVRNLQDAKVPAAVRAEDAKQRSQDAEGDVGGFYYGGKVYLVADSIDSGADVQRILFHEALGHAGLRAVFGKALAPILGDIAVARAAEVRAKAAEYGLDFADPQQRQAAAEEVLAEMAQTRPELGFVKRAVAAVRTWLRANVPGFANLKLSDAEIIQNYLVPARGFIERGRERAAPAPGPAAPLRQEPAFSRSAPAGQPARETAAAQTPAQRLKAKVQQLTSGEAIDNLIYQFQDKFIDLKRLQAHIKELGGTVTDLNDAYLGEELYHKRVAKRTEDFLADELKPLLAEMRAKGVKHSELEQFLHARHAPEANRVLAARNPTQAMIDAGKKGPHPEEWARAQAFQGTEAERLSLSGMSDAEAAAIKESLTPQRRAALESLAKRVDAMNAKTMSELEKYGLMDKASLDAWRQTYQYYVPLHRDEAHPDSSSHPIGQGFSVKGDAAKRRTGSNEKVTHILGHIAMQREAALTRGEKNNVAKKLYLLASQNPDASLWSVDKPPMVKTVDGNGFVRTAIDPLYKSKPNVLVVRIAGKDVAITFNERNPQALRLAEAIKNQDATELGWLLQKAAVVTRYFSMINTQLNPIFGIVNFIRDVQGAALNLSSTPLAGKQAQVAKHLLPALRAVYRQERGKGAANAGNAEYIRLWNELQDAGGATGYRALYQTAEDRVKALEAELKKDDAGAARKAFNATLDWLSDYNEAMENSTRVAVYKVALEQGMSKERAASVAKNITVNFNRKGRMGSQIGAGYAFFNAAVQGTTRLAQTMSGPAGRKIIAGGLAVGMLNTLAGMAMMGAGDDGEDDEWATIPEFVKERNLIIPTGRQDYVTIPMPLGFHALPNLGRLATELAVGGPEKTAGKQFGKALASLLDAFNPLGGGGDPGLTLMPTALDPVWSLATNRDWTGKPIARQDTNSMDPTPGHTRAKESASIIGKKVSEALNAVTGGTEFRPGAISWTPDQIDYVVGQLTGGLGREAMKVEQTISSAFNGDELPSYKVPLVGRVVGNTRGPAAQSGAFYENARELNEIENEIQGRAKAGQDVGAYLASEPLAALVGAGNAAERQIANLRKARRAVIASGRDGAKEEAEAINGQIGEIMGRLNRDVAQARRASQSQ